MENIENALSALEKRGYIAKYFLNYEDMKCEIEKNLTKEEQIGFGGSMTIAELGLQEQLLEDGFSVCNAQSTNLTYEEVALANRTADVYFASVNAITEDGIIVNLDGTGNRIAGTAFGAKKVFYIVGVNKFTKNIEEAIYRVKNVASPKNCMRLGKKTPCAVTGKCSDCSSPERICRGWLINERAFTKKQTFVYIINKQLGF